MSIDSTIGQVAITERLNRAGYSTDLSPVLEAAGPTTDTQCAADGVKRFESFPSTTFTR